MLCERTIFSIWHHFLSISLYFLIILLLFCSEHNFKTVLIELKLKYWWKVKRKSAMKMNFISLPGPVFDLSTFFELSFLRIPRILCKRMTGIFKHWYMETREPVMSKKYCSVWSKFSVTSLFWYFHVFLITSKLFELFDLTLHVTIEC